MPLPHFLCGVVEGFYGRPWTLEQRRELFTRMQRMGMTEYMYAPKDDLKHRAEWRLPYTDGEIECLRALITSAHEKNVIFIYALSPGIDIQYSSEKEVETLLKKFKQVRELGCYAFAILFDDIEIRMSEPDSQRFGSFAAAQVHVANAIYESLAINCRSMLFCPTEYCESRAVPSLATSHYLNTVGSKLHPDIHILWTGPRVISRIIDEDHCEKVAQVLRRRPLIWDNIHANDYDPRRVFLGPYSGRPIGARAHMSGVLTNPNCEFEANYIAMSTLARWVRCPKDVPYVDRDLSIAVLQPDDAVIDADTYHPSHALGLALQEWMHIIHSMYRTSSTTPPMSAACAVVQRAMSVASSSTAATTTTIVKTPTPSSSTTAPSTRVSTPAESVHSVTSVHSVASVVVAESIAESTGQSVASEATAASGVTSAGQSIATSLDDNTFDMSIPMAQTGAGVLPPFTPVEIAAPIIDPNVLPPLVAVNTSAQERNAGAPMASTEAASANADGAMFNSLAAEYTAVEPMEVTPSSATTMSISAPMSIGGQLPIAVEGTKLESASSSNGTAPREGGDVTLDDMAIIVDLFYMPFEHGATGRFLSVEYTWLRENANVEVAVESYDPTSWVSRASVYTQRCARVLLAYNRILYSSALPLILDLYSYLYEIHQIVVLLRCSVAWIAEAQITVAGDGNEIDHRAWHPAVMEEEMTDVIDAEDEPWVTRGGLISELHAALLRSTQIGDLFTARPLPPPSHSTYSIRPYLEGDMDSIYEVCTRSFDDGVSAANRFGDYGQLVGDRLVGGILNHSPQFCFVLEEQNRFDAINQLDRVSQGLPPRDDGRFSRRIVGFVCCAMDARNLSEITRSIHAARMCDKYSTADSRPCQMNIDDGEVESGREIMAEDLIDSFSPSHPPTRWTCTMPSRLAGKYPSLCVLRVEQSVQTAAIKMLLAMACTALHAKGSSGVYAVYSTKERNLAEQLNVNGFADVGVSIDAEETARCLCDADNVHSELAAERSTRRSGLRSERSTDAPPTIHVHTGRTVDERGFVFLARQL